MSGLMDTGGFPSIPDHEDVPQDLSLAMAVQEQRVQKLLERQQQGQDVTALLASAFGELEALRRYAEAPPQDNL